MNVFTVAPSALAGLLVLRRFLEFRAVGACLREAEDRRRGLETHRNPETELPHLIILLPLYQEQLVVERLFHHFRQFRYPPSRLRVVFITTAKETSGTGPSTEEMLAALFAANPEPHFLHLHFPRLHRFRAEQLNFAIERLCAESPHAATYVGVYNADSLPDEDTFAVLASDACRQKQTTGEFPAAYQQGARYFAAARHDAIHSAHAIAAFQTFYTFAHYLPRLYVAERGKNVPVTFLGHGEFIRLDILVSLGLFPNYAYADGLLMGWEVAFGGYPIRVLPALDHCEVPGGLRITVRQHVAWFLGLLNLDEAVRSRFRKDGGSARAAGIRLFCARRMLSTLAWGLRSVYLAALLGFALVAGWRSFAFAAAAVVFYAASPLIYLNRMNTGLWTSAERNGISRHRVMRLAASIPALFVDGIGFWKAAAIKLKSRTVPAMPAKTDR